MRFLIDVQLPRGICTGLSKRGHEGVHVRDVLGGQTHDKDIAGYAIAEGLVLMSGTQI